MGYVLSIGLHDRTTPDLVTLDSTTPDLVFGAKGSNETTIKIGEACVKESTEENLLGIRFDQPLSFKQHVKALCKKASQKLHALARISRYMDTEKL